MSKSPCQGQGECFQRGAKEVGRAIVNKESTAFIGCILTRKGLSLIGLCRVWELPLLASSVQFRSFQSLSPVGLLGTPWTAARQASLSITNSCCCCCVALVVSDSVQPHRRQPTRLPVPGILQARTLEWVAISFSNAWKWKVKVKSLSCVRL